MNEQLRAWLRRLVFTGLPLIAGCSGPGPCPTPAARDTPLATIPDGGLFLPDGGLDCRSLCTPPRINAWEQPGSCFIVTVDGGQALRCMVNETCIGGRRPSTHAAGSGDAWLTRLAYLESVSVEAF